MTYDPIDTSATDNAADGSVTTDTLNSTTVDNSGTVTTQDIVVNGTATGPFGGGGVVLEAGDTITVETIFESTVDESFTVLYDDVAKDVLGGIVSAPNSIDFRYVFSDDTSLRKNGTGTAYTKGNESSGVTASAAGQYAVDFLPPAKQVKKIEVGANNFSGGRLGAEVIFKD